MWSNDIKYKYMFIFPLKNLARKEGKQRCRQEFWSTLIMTWRLRHNNQRCLIAKWTLRSKPMKMEYSRFHSRKCISKCGLQNTNHSWSGLNMLYHWVRVTHICVSNSTIIGLDNGLSPVRCQAIIWTNVRILLIGPLGTNFSEILIKNLHIFIK